MLRKLLSQQPIFENWMVLVRIFSGIIIAWYGLEMFNPVKIKGDVDWLTDIHFPAPVFMTYLGKTAELVGGLLLIIGLFTRLAAIILVINMSVIVFVLGKGNIFGDEQLAFLLLLLFISFIICGGGKWSLDRMVFHRGK